MSSVTQCVLFLHMCTVRISCTVVHVQYLVLSLSLCSAVLKKQLMEMGNFVLSMAAVELS